MVPANGAVAWSQESDVRSGLPGYSDMPCACANVHVSMEIETIIM